MSQSGWETNDVTDEEKKKRAEEERAKLTREEKAQRAKKEKELDRENRKKYDAIYRRLGSKSQDDLYMAMGLANEGKNARAISYFGLAHLAQFEHEKTTKVWKTHVCQKKYVAKKRHAFQKKQYGFQRKYFSQEEYVSPKEYYSELISRLLGYPFWRSPAELMEAMLPFFDDLYCSCQDSECQSGA